MVSINPLKKQLMNIAVFASEQVGYEIVSHFKARKKKLVCLVLDVGDPQNMNKTIIESAYSDHILYSDFICSKVGLDFLKSIDIELGILAWWPQLITEPLLHIPKYGFINMHPSYLPYNRGKHYYFWNIVEELPFGVSLHFINKNIDAGDIAFQKRVEKGWEDTGFSLREKSLSEIVSLFRENFDVIVSGQIPHSKQNLEAGTFHQGSELENASRIDLDGSYSARRLLNIIRGRSGFQQGGAWFCDNNEKYEINITIKRVKSG
jgi:methionyl-tRNA formyltransferase